MKRFRDWLTAEDQDWYPSHLVVLYTVEKMGMALSMGILIGIAIGRWS